MIITVTHCIETGMSKDPLPNIITIIIVIIVVIIIMLLLLVMFLGESSLDRSAA